MSVIIRLQNLPWSANAHDIREFFVGQSIPEGGVHIVGGELGDAFIAFSTDEDARLAMRKTGTALKGIQISLLLSSRAEMQKVIETARQQALGMQTYIAPPAPVPQQAQPQVFPQATMPPNIPQSALPTNIPQSALPPNIPQSAPLQSFPQSAPQFQAQIIQAPLTELSDDHSQQMPNAPGVVYGTEQLPNQHPYNQQGYGNPMQQQFVYQRTPISMGNYPPGVVPPAMNASPYYGQPAMNTPPMGLVLPPQVHNSPNAGNGSPSNNAHGMPPNVMQQGPSFPPPAANVSAPSGPAIPEKIVKRSSSTSSKDDKEKRDSKSRDERRRHSKSRSRSRDRERRRRHRSRSRSRSRDRSGRRRRSRSKERERKERERVRENKDRNRPSKDRMEKEGYEDVLKLTKPVVEGGIPGLGEIPVDIPKEGLSIFSSVNPSLGSQGPITSSNEWPTQELKVDNMPVQDITMEDASLPGVVNNLPFQKVDKFSPKPMGSFPQSMSPSNFGEAPIHSSPILGGKRDNTQLDPREPPKMWNQMPPFDPRRMREDQAFQGPPPHMMNQNGIPVPPLSPEEIRQLPNLPPHDNWTKPPPESSNWNRMPEKNEWKRPRTENWNESNSPSLDGDWNRPQANEDWQKPGFNRNDNRNNPSTLERVEDRNMPVFNADLTRNPPPFNADGVRCQPPFNVGDMRNQSPFNDGGRNRPPFNRDVDRSQPPFNDVGDRGRSSFNKDGDRNRPPFENLGDRNRPPFNNNERNIPPFINKDGDRSLPPFIKDGERIPPFNKDGDRSVPPFNKDRDRNIPPFIKDGESSRPPFIEDGDRSRPPFNKDEVKSKSPYKDGDRSRPPFNKDDDRSRPPFNRDGERNRPPFNREGDRSRPPFSKDFDRNVSPFNKGDRSHPPFNSNGDGNRPPHDDRSAPSHLKEADRTRPSMNRDSTRPLSEGRVPSLMGDDFRFNNSPIGKVDERSAPSNFVADEPNRIPNKDREGTWFRDRNDFPPNHTMRTPSFSGSGDTFGSFRGNRRGGYEGRDVDNDMGGAGFRDRGSYYRDRHEADAGFRGRPRGGGRGGFMRGGRMDGPDHLHRDRNVASTCIEVLHLAPNLKHKAVKDFFVGAGIMVPSGSIKIIGDKQGNPIGVALLKLGTTRDATRATDLTGTYIYDSCVEINLIDEGLYHEMKDIGLMSETADIPSRSDAPKVKVISACLYVRGLPVGCTDHDVAKVFEKFKVEDIVLELEKGSRQPSGGCFVRLNSSDEAAFAFDKLRSPNIDGTPITIKMCTREEMDIASKEREKINIKNNMNKLEKKPEETKCLRNNPPDSKVNATIPEAQNNPGNKPLSVNRLSPSNKPAPLSKQTSVNRSSPVTKPPINKPASINKLTPLNKPTPPNKSTSPNKPAPLDKPAPPSKPTPLNKPSSVNKPTPLNKQAPVSKSVPVNSPSPNSSGSESNPAGADLLTDSVVLKNVSSEVTEVCIRDFFSDEGLIPEKIYFNKPDSAGKTDVFVIFPKITNASKALSKSSQLLRGAPVTIALISKPAVMMAMGLPFNPLELFQKGIDNDTVKKAISKTPAKDESKVVPKKPLLQNPDRMLESELPEYYPEPRLNPPYSTTRPAVKTADPPQDFGQPGCVISLANVPFRATTEDILDFFREYASKGIIRPENVIRRYDEMNRPTSDARVAFPNPAVASTVIRQLDRKTIMNRPIYLKLVL